MDELPHEPVSVLTAKEYLTTDSANRAAVSLAALVFVICSIQALVGATRIGISNDEPTHQSRMEVWFEKGWYVPEQFFDEYGRRRSELEPGRWHSYGAAYSLYGHAVSVVAGTEEWGSPVLSAEAYDSRGVAVAILGILAAAAVGVTVATATMDAAAGFWGAAATMALPLWTGYSMFAVKDVPAAAGWTFVTAALILGLERPDKLLTRISIGFLSAVGVWFSVGVRTALWVPVAASVAAFSVFIALRGKQHLANAVCIAAGLITGMTAVAIVHYRNIATPVAWLAASVKTSGAFHWTGATLSAGHLVTERPPWWYLPAWIGGSTPIMIGLLGLVGLSTAIAWRLRSERLPHPLTSTVLWGIQAFLLPVVAIGGGATMYAGMRQHLYVLPALAALSAVGVHTLRHVIWRRTWLLSLIMSVALAVPVVEQAQLFPYQFVYKNMLAAPINDRWEADMHFVSAREAITQVPYGVKAWCYTQSIRLLSGELRDPPRLTPCAEHPAVQAFIHEQGANAVTADRPDGVWVVGRKYRGSPPPASCERDHDVTRQLRGETVVLAFVLRCPASILPENSRRRVGVAKASCC